MKNFKLHLLVAAVLVLTLVSCASIKNVEVEPKRFSQVVDSHIPAMIAAMENMAVGETSLQENEYGVSMIVKPQDGLIAMRTELAEGNINSSFVNFLYALDDGYQSIQFLKNRKTGLETSFIINISADGLVAKPIYASTNDDSTEGDISIALGELFVGEEGTLQISSAKASDGSMQKVQRILDNAGAVLSTTETIIENQEDNIYVHALSMDGDIAKARVEFTVRYGEKNTHEIHILDDKAMVVLTYESKDGVEDLLSASLLHVMDTVSFIVDTTLDDVFALKHYKGGTVLEEDMLGKHNDRVMVDDDTLHSISIPHDGAGRVDSYTYRHGEGYQQICKFDDRMSHAECIIVFEVNKEDLLVRPVYFTAYSENPELKFGFYPNKPFALFQYSIETSVNADGSVLKNFALLSPQGEFLGHSELLIQKGEDGKLVEEGKTILADGTVTAITLRQIDEGKEITALDEDGTMTVLF